MNKREFIQETGKRKVRLKEDDSAVSNGQRFGQDPADGREILGPKEEPDRRQRLRTPRRQLPVAFKELQRSQEELKQKVQDRTSELIRMNEELLRREREFRTLVENSPDIVLRLDKKLRYRYICPEGERYLGRALSEITGRTGKELGYSDGLWNALRERCEEAIRTGQKQRLEFDFKIPGGSVRHLESRIIPESSRRRSVETVMIVIRDLTEWKEAEKALRRSEKRLRYLSDRLLAAQEEERKRLARDLHDSVGASLSAVKYQVEKEIVQITQECACPKGLQLRKLIPVIQGTIEDTRRIYMNLRPSILDDFGIVATLGWLCREFRKAHPEVEVQWRGAVQESEISEPLKIMLFRIAQEAMNNCAEHSRADRISLSLVKRDSRIQLTVEDNGRGFDPAEVESQRSSRGGLGLVSMRERAELSGGTLTVTSVKDKGTSVQAAWPLISKSR